MALVERIGTEDHAAEWHRALNQYFKIVARLRRVLGLVRGARAPPARSRAPGSTGAPVSTRRWARSWRSAGAAARRPRSSPSCSSTRSPTPRSSPSVADEAAIEEQRDRLERSFHDALRAREADARRRIEALYGHREARFEEEAGLERPVYRQDLFAEEA